MRLVYTEEYATKSEAMRREAALKRLTHAQKAALAAPALAAWEYLAQRPACVDMQEALRWGKAGVVAAEKSGVLLRACRGAAFCWPRAHGPRRPALHRAGPPAPGAMLGVHGRAAALAAAEMMGQPLPPACTQAVYWGVQPPFWQAKGVRLQRWAPNGQNLFVRTMPCFPATKWLRALRRGLRGAFLPGPQGWQLAGFIGQHPGGSMDMLTVLPQFRRMGLGAALEAHAIARLLRQGRVPFCYISAGNRASLALPKKLGLCLRRDLYWLGGA